MSNSLIQLLRDKYTECLTSTASGSKWRILVLDQQVQARMAAVLGMFAILELGIQQVELLENTRNPFPKLEAIYILTPSSQNIARLINDFLPAQPATKKSPVATPGPKYAAAHVFFIDSVSERDANALLQSPARDHLQTFKELYLSFSALEAQVFSLRQPQSFWTLYGPPSISAKEAFREWDATLDDMAQSIVNLCFTLAEFPEIRYYEPRSAGRATIPVHGGKEHPTGVLADKVYQLLRAYQRENEGWPPEGERPRAVLFITDRSMDLAAPFLHEFTYQAMCNDLLTINDGSKYKHSFKNEQGITEEVEVTLDDEDKVWVDVRHMHMKDALETLVAAFNQFNQEHGQQTGSSINDLKDMLANLPGMKESKEKLSLHLSLAEQCMALFERKKLPETALVEQSCATGMNAEGKPPKTLVEEMVPLLDDRSLSLKDKVRIIALYILYRDGVPDEDRKRLYQHARLGMPEVDAVNNLVRLGQEVTKDSSKKRKALFKQTMSDEAYDISRYQPAVRLMMEEHFAGKLDKSNFPNVGTTAAVSHPSASLRSGDSLRSGSPATGATSLRSTRPRWTAGSKGKITFEPKQRVIVFVAGGMTYSEIRSAYQVSSAFNKDVYIGSTHVITPEQFITDLARIDRPPSSRPSPQPAQSSSSSQRQGALSSTSSSSRPRPQQIPDHAQQVAQDPRQPPSSSRGPASNYSNGYADPQLQRQQQSQYLSSSSDPRASTSSRNAPRPGNTSSNPNSVASSDFVPQLRVPSSSSGASAGHAPLKHNLSQTSDTSSTQPKKKGLFGRLK